MSEVRIRGICYIFHQNFRTMLYVAKSISSLVVKVWSSLESQFGHSSNETTDNRQRFRVDKWMKSEDKIVDIPFCIPLGKKSAVGWYRNHSLFLKLRIRHRPVREYQKHAGKALP